MYSVNPAHNRSIAHRQFRLTADWLSMEMVERRHSACIDTPQAHCTWRARVMAASKPPNKAGRTECAAYHDSERNAI
jgi:hypothetical protein